MAGVVFGDGGAGDGGAGDGGAGDGGAGGGVRGRGSAGGGFGGVALLNPAEPLEDAAALGTAPLLLGASFPAAGWAPALRAQVVLAGFSGTAWKDAQHGLAAPAHDEAAMGPQVKQALKLMPQRAGRLGEILAQDAALDAPFLALLMAAPGGRPGLSALAACALAVGHMVGMHWKAQFNAPRPVQVYPALLPVIPTPPHPSFPSNHALQSYLLAALLLEALPAGTPAQKAGMGRLFERLAARVAQNREIAGVHFQRDSQAGKALALKILPLLLAVPELAPVLAEARAELGGIAFGAPPGKP